MKVKNDAGEEIEVMTIEESQAKVDAEKQVWEEKSVADKTALDEAIASKERLETDLATARAGGSDSSNFAALKSKLDQKDSDIKALQESDKRNSEVRRKDIETDIFAERVKNPETLKKVQFHYDKTLAAVKAESRSEIAAKIDSAIKLASDVVKVVDSAAEANFGGGGMGDGGGQGTATGGLELTAGQKSLATKLGITDADLKKYGPRIK